MMSYLFNFISAIFVAFFASMVMVNFLPESYFKDFPFEPKSVDLPLISKENPDWNTKLTDGLTNYMFLNRIVGPESMAISPDEHLYTGLADGRIVRIDSNNKLETVYKFNKSPKCKDNDASQPEFCGRFLQLRFHNKKLYAMEASTGLYEIDVVNGLAVQIYANPHSQVNLYNSFVFDTKDPDLFFISITSRRWPLSKIIWSILELENSGRIVASHLKTNKTVVVSTLIYNSNGINVDPINDQLIFSETSLWKVSKISLPEIRRQFDKAENGALLPVIRSDFIKELPGNPDNIFVKDNIAYIALPRAVKSGLEIATPLAKYPAARKAIARLIYGTGVLLEHVNSIYSHPTIEYLSQLLKNAHIIYAVSKTQSGVIEYDLAKSTYKFLGTDKFAFISEAIVDDKGKMYLGSFRSPFIAKIDKP